VSTRVSDPVHLPADAWRRPDVCQALRARDIGTLLRLAQQHTGASQARLAGAIGIGQGRLNELINRRREVSRLEIFERVADGLDMPDAPRMLLGLAPAIARLASDIDELSGASRAVSRTYRAQSAAFADIRHAAAMASELDVLAVRGLGLLGLNDSLLRTVLTSSRAAPLAIRVLIVDAASDAAIRRAREIGESQESFASGIRLAEHKLAELAERPGIALTAYRYATLPVWRIIATDGTTFVSTFDEDWEGHASPVYRIDIGTGGALHRGFRRMFNEFAATAERFI